MQLLCLYRFDYRKCNGIWYIGTYMGSENIWLDKFRCSCVLICFCWNWNVYAFLFKNNINLMHGCCENHRKISKWPECIAVATVVYQCKVLDTQWAHCLNWTNELLTVNFQEFKFQNWNSCCTLVTYTHTNIHHTPVYPMTNFQIVVAFKATWKLI